MLQRRFEFGAALGARLRGGTGIGEEAGDMCALFGERGEHPLGVGGELGELVALVGEDLEKAVGFAEVRVRPFDRRLDVGASTGEGGPEFVEDEAEALRVGQRVDVVDQVGVDAGAVVLERQQALAGAGLSGGDDAQRRRRLGAGRPRQGRPAVDVLLADQRLGPDDAVRVLRKSWKPEVSIFITITALPGIASGLPPS